MHERYARQTRIAPIQRSNNNKKETTSQIHPKRRKLIFTEASLMSLLFLNLPYNGLSRSWWRCVLFTSSGASPIRTRVGAKIVQADAKSVLRVQQ